VTSAEESTMKRVSAPVSRLASLTRRSVEAMNGLRYFALWLASRARPWYCSAEPWTTSCSPLRVRGSSVLKSWSRSTGVVVARVGRVAPSSSSGALVGPSWSEM
jgi:hypothetical protein